jgi:hypothetical protein
VLVRLGAVLIAVSCLLWGALLVVPALPGTAAARAARAGVIFVAAEIVWWVGVALVGGAAWRVVRQQGWRQLPRALWQLLRHGRAVSAPLPPPG